MTNTQKVKLKLPRFGRASLSERKARKGWLFVLPFVIGFLLIYLPIIIDSICFSFMSVEIKTDAQGVAYTTVVNHHFQYYQNLSPTTNPEFIKQLGDGVKQLVWEVPAIVIFALFVAIILNQKMLGRAVFRAIFFVPVILSTGLMESIQSTRLTGEDGIDDGSGESAADQFISAVDIRLLFGMMKVGGDLVDVVIDLVNNILKIVNYSGVQMLIFLAGLQSISPAIYEAARIDGASAWETFWKITFPMISPMILVNGIYTIIDSFTRQNNPVMKYIERIYDSDQSQATAEYWVYFLIVFAIVAVFAGIVSAYVFYQRRD